MRRRKLLAFLGGSMSVAAAGCIGDSDDDEVADETGEDGEEDEREPDLDPAEFAVGVAESNSPVEAGDILEISIGVTNVGEESGEETIVLTLSGVGEVDQTDVELDGGDSIEEILGWDTSEGDSGEYDAEVRSDDDSDAIAVTVEEPEPEQAVDEVVDVTSNAFEPDLLEVDVGDTVGWEGTEGDHTVTFYHEDNDTQHRIPRGVDALDDDVSEGDQAHFEFTEPGVYDYYCRPHEGQGMVGTVIVGGGDDPVQPGLALPEEGLPPEAASAIEDLNERARDVLGIDPDEAIDEVEIGAYDTEFEPDLVEVSPGAEVTWVGHAGEGVETEDDTPPTVTFYHEDNDIQHRVPEGVEAIDEALEEGEEVTIVVEEPGVYDYYSRGSAEEGMVGSLVVGDHDDPDQPGLSDPVDDLPDAAVEHIEILNQRAIDILGIPTVSEAVEEANATIDVLNTDEDGSIGTINAGLEHMAGVEPIAEVEADSPEAASEEADRLRADVDRLTDEILTQVPEEINEQSQERSGIDLLGAAGTPTPEEIVTADDAREAADSLPSLGADVEEAAEALRNTADIVDAIEVELHRIADELDRTIPDSD